MSRLEVLLWFPLNYISNVIQPAFICFKLTIKILEQSVLKINNNLLLTLNIFHILF